MTSTQLGTITSSMEPSGKRNTRRNRATWIIIVKGLFLETPIGTTQKILGKLEIWYTKTSFNIQLEKNKDSSLCMNVKKLQVKLHLSVSYPGNSTCKRHAGGSLPPCSSLGVPWKATMV